MRYDILFGITYVDGWFEYFDMLPCYFCAFQATNQFFCFAGKHGAANHFDASPPAGFVVAFGNDHCMCVCVFSAGVQLFVAVCYKERFIFYKGKDTF